ncbi:MAG TPA: acyl-ACP--UDP-N-acetylglucosamine O-acyltransferase [Trueperaceae bacterium]|nr:acyl-ACP--UDP-N-acetylglucosamine O-acyltransferase [Trueperaceae bacterium]
MAAAVTGPAGGPAAEPAAPRVARTAVVEDPSSLAPGVVVGEHAVVAAGAELGEGVFVGPGVVVEAGARVGAGTRLLAGSVVRGRVALGARCQVGPYAVLGGEPADTAFHGEESRVVVEDDVTIREFVTVHRATGEGAVTRVGAGTLLLSYSHVSHNCDVGRGCVITNGVQLGGHARVGDRANLGAGSLVHQFCRIGAYAMFGAASAANQDVLPYAMARGNPARHYRLNTVGLRRAGFEGERYRHVEAALRALRRRDTAALEELATVSEEAAQVLEFVRTTKRGVARFVTGGR